jgi:hypothetical protein
MGEARGINQVAIVNVVGDRLLQRNQLGHRWGSRRGLATASKALGRPMGSVYYAARSDLVRRQVAFPPPRRGNACHLSPFPNRTLKVHSSSAPRLGAGRGGPCVALGAWQEGEIREDGEHGRGRRRSTRFADDSFLRRWILPAALVAMAVLTIALIVLALGVLLQVIPWQ